MSNMFQIPVAQHTQPLITPLKFNMEPENDSFLNGICFSRGSFLGSMLNFTGVDGVDVDFWSDHDGYSSIPPMKLGHSESMISREKTVEELGSLECCDSISNNHPKVRH